MKVINLAESNSVLNTFIAQLRDKKIQKDPFRFRTNLERAGQFFACELSKVLNYSSKEVETPLGTAVVPTYDNPLVIATIMRAGLPLHKGLLDMFESAESAFVAAYRKYDKGDDFHISIDYCTCPSISGKTLILCDTMIASGASIEATWLHLKEQGGEPEVLHIVTPVASVYAVEDMQKFFPADSTLWVGAIDEELTSQSYIIPGLGDAGDLAFGEKI